MDQLLCDNLLYRYTGGFVDRHVTRDLKDVAAFLFVNIFKASLIYIKIQSYMVIPLFDLVGRLIFLLVT